MTSMLIRVAGAVQGVGYRWFTRGVAEAHEVSGWVRNRRDGSVEAELHGSAEDIAAVVRLLRDGPPHAAVPGISSIELPDPGTRPHGFEIRASV